MSKSAKKKKNDRFQTLFTVLVTLLVVSIIFVLFYGWYALGFSSYSVSYSSSHTNIIGSFPEKRQFHVGDEVVVRAGSITREGSTFVGWKDVHGVIIGKGDVLENGTVFNMPKNDVLLEAIWEDDLNNSENNNKDTSKNTSENKKTEDTKSGKDASIYIKTSSSENINVRSNCSYDSDVIAKISDSTTKIEYYGTSKEVYDEKEDKTYTWYLVKIPDINKEGWIRSDLITEASKVKKEEQKKSDLYLKSNNYESINMYEEADETSEKIATIDDEETPLYYQNKKQETEDSDGNSVTWYLMKNDETGKSGWIQKNQLQHIEE